LQQEAPKKEAEPAEPPVLQPRVVEHCLGQKLLALGIQAKLARVPGRPENDMSFPLPSSSSPDKI
jgi:hypothetical protein